MNKKTIPGDVLSVPIRTGLGILLVLHLVCPLLFFTNLTRNPYYTQIALLNIAVCAAVIAACANFFRNKTWIRPRFPFEWPLALFLGVAFLSTVLSWVDHEFVRVGIVFEGVRIWVFTLVNCVAVLYLPAIFTKPLYQSDDSPSIWSDILFAFVWGLMWFGFHSMKNPDPNSLLWDTYGGFLWAMALGYGWFRVRKGGALGVFHVVFFVSMVAGGYGILQYLGRDIIWGSPIQPYGGRPVSTFGNPNFMSSYLLLASMLALVFSFHFQGKRRWGYGFVFAVCVLSILATLTRSTVVGLGAAVAALGVFLFKREYVRTLKGAGIALGAILVLILIFPSTPVTSGQSPLTRFTEIIEAIQSGEPYAPWHQRVLIWSSAWDMVRERFWLGKGWGEFELFYPFYQGGHLLTDVFGRFRTHANNAHNVLLEVWAQTGLIGTGLAIWLMATLFWGGWKIFQSKPEGLSRLAAAGLLAGFVGMMTDNFFGNVSIFFAVPAFLFWWNMGALYNENEKDRVAAVPFSAAPKRSAGFLLLLVAAGVLGGVYYFQRWKQELYYFEGFKFAKGNRVEQSIKSLEKAVEWFPGEVNTNYELGNSYTRLVQMLDQKGFDAQAAKAREKAVEAYKLALAANPGYDEIYFNLGVIQSQLGHYEEAERNLKIAITVNPLLRDAYGSLSNHYARQGNIAKAGEVLKSAVETFPNDKDLWLNLGYYYSKEGKNEKAFDAYKTAYSLDPQFSTAWNNLRLAAETLGRREPLLEFPTLLQTVQEAIKTQNYKRALAPAEQMVRLLPENAKARLTLAEIYRLLGRPDEARREAQRVLERDPQNTRAKTILSSLRS